MDSLNVSIYNLSYNEVLHLLNEMSHQFDPPLSDSLNLINYAHKLTDNATFLICSTNNETIGSIVFYPNHTTSILYIPLVCVHRDFRGQGIARRMFKYLIEYGKNENLSYIDLEVLKKNIRAFNLYSSLGFSIIEDRNKKYLMRLELKENNQFQKTCLPHTINPCFPTSN